MKQAIKGILITIGITIVALFTALVIVMLGGVYNFMVGFTY